ncbi:MAG: phosphoribosyltransferase [Prevotellaceae bacterium]|jgi:xanthine phosphoribosyltransferase|nr:phosphoribosyltransferase [Prevotellaceae bacterium]
MAAKTMDEIRTRFGSIRFDEAFDMIVAIANGGIVPAGILNQRLQVEVQLLHLNLRDEHQQPRYDAPRLTVPVGFACKGRRILLVDDRIKTGSTIQTARRLLQDAALIRTFAVNGNADYALYDEPCFRMPWLI